MSLELGASLMGGWGGGLCSWFGECTSRHELIFCVLGGLLAPFIGCDAHKQVNLVQSADQSQVVLGSDSRSMFQ